MKHKPTKYSTKTILRDSKRETLANMPHKEKMRNKNMTEMHLHTCNFRKILRRA